MGVVQNGKGKGFLLFNVKLLSLICLVPLSSCAHEPSDTHIPSRAALELHGLPGTTTMPCPLQQVAEGTGRALARCAVVLGQGQCPSLPQRFLEIWGWGRNFCCHSE